MKITQLQVLNAKLAQRKWPLVDRELLERLDHLTVEYGWSVKSGDLILIDRTWYATHSGLLRIACRKKCSGISTEMLRELSDPPMRSWFCRAVVYPSRSSLGFVGLGDADPTNVAPALCGAEMRIAETRAVNRALRKAYGIGLCSVEELDSSLVPPPNGHVKRAPTRFGANLEVITPIPLRDQLRQLIRQQRLDPALTKSYALDHLGVPSLRQATREQVNELITHLQKRLFEDRDQLLSDLLRFASQPTNKEVA